jgi:hypothetical protein
VGHVTRSTQGGGVPGYRNNLDRSLRGYALHFTPQILVDHQIAEYKDSAHFKA